MHSSRMRTGHTLTISGGVGGCASQKGFLGGKEIEKKKMDISDPPENFRPPRKFQTPLPKISDPPVNRNLETRL